MTTTPIEPDTTPTGEPANPDIDPLSPQGPGSEPTPGSQPGPDPDTQPDQGPSD